MLSWCFSGDGKSSAWTNCAGGSRDLGAEAYDRLGYYERWMASMTNLLLEKRIIEVSELGERMAEIEAGKRGGLP